MKNHLYRLISRENGMCLSGKRFEIALFSLCFRFETASGPLGIVRHTFCEHYLTLLITNHVSLSSIGRPALPCATRNALAFFPSRCPKGARRKLLAGNDSRHCAASARQPTHKWRVLHEPAFCGRQRPAASRRAAALRPLSLNVHFSSLILSPHSIPQFPDCVNTCKEMVSIFVASPCRQRTCDVDICAAAAHKPVCAAWPRADVKRGGIRSCTFVKARAENCRWKRHFRRPPVPRYNSQVDSAMPTAPEAKRNRA